jgi:predicted Zn-dependent protease
MKYSVLCFLSFAAFLFSCQKNTVTGRKQLILVDEAELQQVSSAQYRSFLTSHKVMPKGSSQDQVMVTRVGNRIAEAVRTLLAEKGQLALLDGYKWEFNLVEDKQVNAWCMPGGKVVVYSGLMPIARTEAGLAVVMGHEIAHAVAKHGNERMSQALLQQMGGVALSVAMVNQPYATQNLFMSAYGVGSELGAILPFSRKQELEADRYGLFFAARAGYDPREATAFWQRMAGAAGSGQKPPEFMSTHPSDETRIEKIKTYTEEAMKYYKPANQ